MTRVNEVEVRDFPRYTVDINGNVFSNVHNTHRRLKYGINGYGYAQVHLCDTKKCKYAMVSRLVAEAFIGTIPPKMQVNHIDGDKLNNKVSNLEIVTCVQNIRHAIDTGLHADLRMPVKQMDLQGNCVAEHSPILSASGSTGVHRGHISEVVNGKRQTAGGYRWVA